MQPVQLSLQLSLRFIIRIPVRPHNIDAVGHYQTELCILFIL